MWLVEIEKRDGAHSTLPDYDPSPSFFRIAETDEMLEDLNRIFENRILAVRPLEEGETLEGKPGIQHFYPLTEDERRQLERR